ncbi:MAG: histidine--tRNA ligase [Parcubacteria group bacterium]|nr:histidine--tRNA ligase [Parcubacteria group bacterium]
MPKKESSPKKNAAKEAKSLLLQSPRGMHDTLPQVMPLWDKIREEARRVADFYGFAKIETPILEAEELFRRGTGETTDVVEKEMYVLKTKGGDRLALRPEFTPSMIRSYLQHGMHRLPQPRKLYSIGPVFRHERPQAGRYRQHHQIDFEVIGGESDPVNDAQVIIMFFRLMEELKLKPLLVQINSIGCRICRPNYRKKLVDYYRGQSICRDCEKRIKTNPLRLLDCKKEKCEELKAGAPSILDSICSLCRNHLKQVLEFLEEVNLPYLVNHLLVRGLDYYSRTVFEIFLEEKGSVLPAGRLALAGGGRYDYLAEVLGGRSTPAVGGAMGIERIADVIRETQPNTLIQKVKPRIFLVHIGDLAKKKSLSLMEEFRQNNIPVISVLGKNSLSQQLEAANKVNSPLTLILGQREVYEQSIIIRDMDSGAQEPVPLGKVVEEVKKRLRA